MEPVEVLLRRNPENVLGQPDRGIERRFGDSAPLAEIQIGLAGLDDQEVARRTPDDIEAIIDDDIVAKQLREAAMAEEDPELRERLWEEYRKYKQGTR